MEASLIVIFSTAGGLLDEKERIVPLVEDIDNVIPLVKGVNSEFGTGGMLSKITATRIATKLGIPVVITGKEDSLFEIVKGKTKGTYFKASSKPLREGKKVLAMFEEPKGALYIDDGAYRAIKQGKSLLPAGIFEEALKIGAKCVWLQPGCENMEVIEKYKDKIGVVWNACIGVEARYL